MLNKPLAFVLLGHSLYNQWLSQIQAHIKFDRNYIGKQAIIKVRQNYIKEYSSTEIINSVEKQ